MVTGPYRIVVYADDWEMPASLGEWRNSMPFAKDTYDWMINKCQAENAWLHTWDLAKALGRPFNMPEEIAASTLEMMQQFYNPDQRGTGKAFGHAVPCPESAPVQDRLIALSGRQP